MKNNYLLEGSDYVALKIKIDNIIELNKFNDATVSFYDLNECGLDSVLEDLDTYSFLSLKKVIIAKNISNCLNDNEKSLNHLLKYVSNSNPDNMFIAIADKFDDRKKVVKQLKRDMEYIHVSVNTMDYIKKELSDYKLDNGVVSLIDEYSQGDITKIYNDCEKLKQYKYDTHEISVSDVNDLCIKKVGDTTSKTFDFVRAFAQKNKKRSLEIFHELLDSGIDAIAVLGLIGSQIRIMYQVKILSKDGLSDKKIAEELGEKSSYRITKTKELIRYYEESELRNIMKMLSDIDFRIKTQGVDSTFLLEMLIIEL